MTFTARSIAALKNFWRTAVVIDDTVEFDSESVPQTKLLEPRRGTLSVQQDQPSQFINAPLNGSAIVDAFWRHGILCTILKYHDTLMNDINTLLRSDILVLDWKLQDDGENVVNFIKCCADKYSNALHLICIYTAEKDMESIKKKMQDFNLNLTEYENKNVYSIESIYILVLNKPGAKEIKPLNGTGIISVEPENLPEILLNEFAQVVGGLLRNAVFHSIGAIRNNTYALLNRFSADLDPSFVTHRIYSMPCDDTEQHIIPLICSEIGSILRQENISMHLNKGAIYDLIYNDAMPKIKKEIFESNIEEEIFNSAINHILSFGIDSKYTGDDSQNAKLISNAVSKLRSRSRKATESNMTALWGSENSSLADAKLSILMSCTHFYNSTMPILQSGSIIKKDEKYYVCIQPPCDCYRIKEGRYFLFISLNTVNKDEGFDITLLNHTEVIYLARDKKIYNLKSIYFEPQNTEESISALKFGDDFVFESTYEDKFIFCAQLNEVHAIRLIQKYSENLARIGLIESDWQRRCCKN